jgi:hypothetical protein
LPPALARPSSISFTSLTVILVLVTELRLDTTSKSTAGKSPVAFCDQFLVSSLNSLIVTYVFIVGSLPFEESDGVRILGTQRDGFDKELRQVLLFDLVDGALPVFLVTGQLQFDHQRRWLPGAEVIESLRTDYSQHRCDSSKRSVTDQFLLKTTSWPTWNHLVMTDRRLSCFRSFWRYRYNRVKSSNGGLWP